MGRSLAQAKMPIWAFHGVNDAVVSVENTDRSMDEYRKAWSGAPANAVKYNRIDIAPDRDPNWPVSWNYQGHASWVNAYEGIEGGRALFEWFLSFKKD